jgi:hypothetical protein
LILRVHRGSAQDQPTSLLQAQIGMETETRFAVPDIAERHRQPQLASPGFGSCTEHLGTKHAELELADRAFHTEQQPAVRMARIVDAIEIDDAGSGQSVRPPLCR